MHPHNLRRLVGIGGVLLLMVLMVGSTVAAQPSAPEMESQRVGPHRHSLTANESLLFKQDEGRPGQLGASNTLTPTVFLPVVTREWPPILTRTPNDPYYTDGTQWNLDQISGPAAWARNTGSASVIVAIVDTGVDTGHPDLAGKTVAGASFVPGAPTPADDNGHGTHCAGIAGAVTDNGVGVAGVSWGARIMPVKVLDELGSGYTSWIANGIRWAADNGARAINLSLAGEGSSSTMQNAVNYAHGKGCLVVAAVGNCGDPSNYDCSTWNPIMYPAASPNVLGVGATGDLDERAVYSEFNYSVDVTAPGGNPTSGGDTNPRHWIISTWLGHGYAQIAGTSQAAPHVAGLAALVWSVNPGLTPDQVQSVIQNGADDLGPAGRDDEFGYGRINAATTLGLAATTVQSAAGDTPATAAGPLATGPVAANEFAPGVVLVKFKPGVSAAARQTALDAQQLTVLSQIPNLHILRVRVPAGQELATAQRLAGDPQVEYAELDLVYRAQ